jgi:hypothetical protein
MSEVLLYRSFERAEECKKRVKVREFFLSKLLEAGRVRH